MGQIGSVVMAGKENKKFIEALFDVIELHEIWEIKENKHFVESFVNKIYLTKAQITN